MIDEQPSLAAAEKVSLSDLTKYLLASGWKMSSSKMKDRSIFSIILSGSDHVVQVLLPTSKRSDDDRRRMADALRTLSALEECELSKIISEIKSKRKVKSENRRSHEASSGGFFVGTYPISDIDGLTTYSASKLKSVGIRTTSGLLEAARTVKGRKALAAKTGISEQHLLDWANFSDYMRIPGMGKAKVGLVRAAGVLTVRELALRNPARLTQNMKSVNSKRKLVRILPSEKSVEQLIEMARRLQSKVRY
jgi:hypothetical protein